MISLPTVQSTKLLPVNPGLEIGELILVAVILYLVLAAILSGKRIDMAEVDVPTDDKAVKKA